MKNVTPLHSMVHKKKLFLKHSRLQQFKPFTIKKSNFLKKVSQMLG